MIQFNETAQTSQSFLPDSTLWQALNAFTVDEPGTQLSFVQRLARENRWSLAYAQRVFEEYKRFIFLAVSAGHHVTPSDEVDQAWHLHLAYTESYWTELCGKLLGQPLHHGPTKGGQQEDDKYFDLYTRTLASYERIFGHKPPADIWPSPQERFDRKLRFERLNTAEYWLLKKPEWNVKRLAAYAAVTLFSGLTLSACKSVSPGGLALLIAGGSIIVIVGLVSWLHSQGRGKSDGKSDVGSSGCGGLYEFGYSSDSDGDSGGDGGSSGCSSSGCGGGGCSS